MTYRVDVSRTVLQYAAVEVEAESETEAARFAEAEASTNRYLDWQTDDEALDGPTADAVNVAYVGRSSPDAA